ncbi:MAG: helix-turn-helix transcriptional regulator [Ignavibacteria bacterium]|nr:helix-turn-helix transcriptional regulator [Ignavibacteria bacterium]
MEYLQKGKYYGIPQKTLSFNGLLLVDNEYVKDKVDWHYHENAYFTYLLKGKLIETSKKTSHTCVPGTLLFHYSGDPHYNIKPPGYTRGFQIEFNNSWFSKHGLQLHELEGSGSVSSKPAAILFKKIYNETIVNDRLTPLAIEGLLLQVFAEMLRRTGKSAERNSPPLWLGKVAEILREESEEKITLSMLARMTGHHPVHISKSFHKHFGVTMGQYIRNFKIERSVKLLREKNLTLTEISSACGFADQSHFIRTFKMVHGITPSMYRKIFL